MDSNITTSSIQKTIFNHIKLSPEDKETVELILCDKINLPRCEFILDYMFKAKLDKSSILAFLTYQLFKVDPQKADLLLERLTKEENELVDSFKLIKDIQNLTPSEEADDIKKMFLALSKDVRIVIIKLAGIAYDIEKLKTPLSPTEKRFVELANEIHIPLAERLGLDGLKLAMDDNVIRLEHFQEYENIRSYLEQKKEENEQQLEISKRRIEEVLQELGIKGEIKYRQKHISSIYKKLQAKHSIDKIYDLLAMRVIVDNIEECYAILGRVHQMYKPMPGRVKDYIANPKPNGYQSLHTTVIVENQHPLEIQIRTHEMHRASEFGSYAHWLYKEKSTKKDGLDTRVTWIREAIDNAKDLPPEEFVETLKADLYGGVIFCQTPKGRVIEFPDGATAIDFAYAIHSDIGNKCVGVKINSKIKPISTPLKNGDIVEVLTNPNKAPSRDWLNIAKTNSARSKIRTHFKNELKEENIKNGKNMFEGAIKERGFTASQLLTDKYLDEVLPKLTMKEMDELYAAIGSGSLSIKQVVGRFVGLWNKDNVVKIKQETTVTVRKNKEGILIDGDSGMLVRYAGCCNPIEGDDIVGYVSRGKGVTIHRHACANLKYLEPERLISATWATREGNSFIATIHVIADKSNNNIAKLTTLITNMKVLITGFDAKDVGDNFICDIAVSVKNKAELEKVMTNIRSLKNITQVSRSERWI